MDEKKYILNFKFNTLNPTGKISVYEPTFLIYTRSTLGTRCGQCVKDKNCLFIILAFLNKNSL